LATQVEFSCAEIEGALKRPRIHIEKRKKGKQEVTNVETRRKRG